MKALKPKITIKNLLALAPMLLVTATILFASAFYGLGSNQLPRQQNHTFKLASSITGPYCGAKPQRVATTIDFGCRHQGNPITDIIFSVIRFLSAGVGMVIILSVIIGGIQYILARGDPNATSKAVNRLVSAVVALILFIFAYAILSYLIPAGFFV